MFYHFRQNNSGGNFVIDAVLTVNVIIEADSADEANAIALTKGIYFNGVEYERDCDCCGDRWYPVDEEDAKDKPFLYGKTPEDYATGENSCMWADFLWAEKGENVVVYYKDCRVSWF